MWRDNHFSIYPNQSTRVALHILYWIIVYFFTLFINGFSFEGNIFNPPNLLFSTSTILTTALVHYFICYVTFPKVRQKKWLQVILHLFFVYIASVLLARTSLVILKDLFPNSRMIVLSYNMFKLDTLRNIFSYSVVLWTLSITIWYNILGIAIKVGKDFYENWQEKLAVIREKNTMELNFLRAQIQPHFLFNALNSIYGLVLENEEASKVVLQLSDLLRFSLYGSAKGEITLREEMEFLTNYILLEKMRHKKSRVSIDYNFEAVENREARITPLILVNFIENAFKHGINASIKNTWVNVVMTEQAGILTFEVSNNKPAPTAVKKKDDQSSGVGLMNVKRRLELEYPDRFSLDIKETEDIYSIKLIIKL